MNNQASSKSSSKRLLAWVVIVSVALVMAVPAGVGAQPAAQPAGQTGWTLVWGDEFNGSGQPSSANWNYHVGNGFNPGLGGFDGWGNGEWEWYRPEQCTQSGGSLVIRADYHDSPTNIAGRDWYQRSCRLTSDTKRSMTYGAIEARIQMPNAIGSWPAFWMMGDACDDTSTASASVPITHFDRMASNWSSCGEVDITEHRNSESVVFQNLFWDTRVGLFPWNCCTNANAPTTFNVGNVNTFHTYRLEWTNTQMRWLVDGSVAKTQSITDGNQEELHKPFHLILNLALSGAFPGAQPNKADFPLFMRVDYVRVYRAGGGPTPTRTNTPGGPTPTRTRTPTGPTRTPTQGGTGFNRGVVNVSSTQARPWFQPVGWTAGYVILHYIRPGLVQQNVNMTYNSGASRWEYTVGGMSPGQTLQYQFTYQRNGLQYDTAWFSWTKP